MFLFLRNDFRSLPLSKYYLVWLVAFQTTFDTNSSKQEPVKITMFPIIQNGMLRFNLLKLELLTLCNFEVRLKPASLSPI